MALADHNGQVGVDVFVEHGAIRHDPSRGVHPLCGGLEVHRLDSAGGEAVSPHLGQPHPLK